MVVKVFLDLINYFLCCSQLIKNKNKTTHSILLFSVRRNNKNNPFQSPLHGILYA